jgi:hypothetical protein
MSSGRGAAVPEGGNYPALVLLLLLAAGADLARLSCPFETELLFDTHAYQLKTASCASREPAECIAHSKRTNRQQVLSCRQLLKSKETRSVVEKVERRVSCRLFAGLRCCH